MHVDCERHIVACNYGPSQERYRLLVLPAGTPTLACDLMLMEQSAILIVETQGISFVYCQSPKFVPLREV